MKVNILGVKIDALTKKQVLKEIELFLRSQQSHYIVTPYSEFIIRARKDSEFKEILNSADIAVPDGMGILWAGALLYENYFSKAQGKRALTKIKIYLAMLLHVLRVSFLGLFFPTRFQSIFPEKVSGVDLIWDIASITEDLQKSVFLLGGWNNTPGTVAAILKDKYPKLKIAGTYDGTAELEKENNNILAIINNAKPDILLVALGPISQEKWIAKNLSELPCVRVVIGLGGTFDYLARKRILAPNFLRKRGLEWLFRLFTQPWRIGRIGKAIPMFVWLVIREKLKREIK